MSTQAITAAREALDRCVILMDATNRFIESNPIGDYSIYFDEADFDGSCLADDCSDAKIRCELAIAQIRAAEAGAGWRPIAESSPGGTVIVGKLHRGEWTWKPTQFVLVAIEDGYTHCLVIPPPPAREGV